MMSMNRLPWKRVPTGSLFVLNGFIDKDRGELMSLILYIRLINPEFKYLMKHIEYRDVKNN